jgi:hypothetical protein
VDSSNRQSAPDTGQGRVESIDRNSRTAGRDSGNAWRRFGSPGSEGQGAVIRGGQQGNEGSVRQDDGWRRIGGRNDESIRSTPAAPAAPAAPERSNRFEGGGRSERFSGSSESRSEPIRISPPIVRERQSPQNESGSWRGDRGFGRGSDNGGMRSMTRGETGGGRISGGGSPRGDGGGSARSNGNGGGRGGGGRGR